MGAPLKAPSSGGPAPPPPFGGTDDMYSEHICSYLDCSYLDCAVVVVTTSLEANTELFFMHLLD